jgi:TRAP-type C4-dicarboxylate transport system permease small subunit
MYCRAEEVATCAGLCVIIVLVFLSAIARFVRHPWNWTIDISLLLLAWVSLLGADIAYRYGAIVGLNIITKKFSDRTQDIIKLIVFALICATTLCLVYFGIKLCIGSRARSFQALKISYSWVTLSLPAASLSFAMTSILEIARIVRRLKA